MFTLSLPTHGHGYGRKLCYLGYNKKKGLGMIKVVKLEVTLIDRNGSLPARRFGLDETVYGPSISAMNDGDLLKNI